MKHVLFFLILTTIFTACSKEPFVPAQLSNNPLESNLDRDLDALIQKHIGSLNTVGLCIGVYQNGNNHIYGYGEVLKGSGQIPDGHTFFEIGSNTKTFTAIATVQWLKEENLELTQPVNSFLPADIPTLSKGGVEVNFQHLLTHSSGLPYLPDNLKLKNDPGKAFANYTEQNFFDFLKQVKLENIPSTTFEYSNSAFGLAGLILARQNGKNYGEYIREKICDPLGLFDTKAVLSSADKTRLAGAYEGGKQVNWWESLGALDGAGIMRSTVSDMLKYGVATISPPDNALGKAMLACQVPTFSDENNLGVTSAMCLGWVETQTPNGSAKVLAHTGGTGGHNTFLVVGIRENMVLTVCYNSYDGSNKKEQEARNAFFQELLLLLW